MSQLFTRELPASAIFMRSRIKGLQKLSHAQDICPSYRVILSRHQLYYNYMLALYRSSKCLPVDHHVTDCLGTDQVKVYGN